MPVLYEVQLGVHSSDSLTALEGNPREKPKEVEYRVKRDAMTPYPAFFAQIAVFGAVHTILPGSTIRKAEK